MPEDHIIALAASKLSDRPDQAELCKKAVELIAADRNSETLRVWAREGATLGDAREEEISAAYRFFNINDRTADIDLEVLAMYTSEYADDPVRNSEALRHYNVIVDLKNKQDLPVGPAAYDRPVGLENMGNTCYLNCLLQFLYTIRPVRELILDFDQFKLDTTDPNFEPKMVDSVTVPKTETQQSQQFVNELRLLFREMSTDPRSAVRPTWDLAKLALQRSTMPAPARRSTIGGDMPFLKSPLRTQAPPLPETSVISSSPFRRNTNSSEVTLIDSVTKTPDEDEDSGMIIEEKDGQPTPVRSESPVELPADPMEEDESAPLLPLNHALTPPLRPPPVPPRPIIGPLSKPEAEKSGWKEESSKREAEQAAQQQDVEEAMSNVLFKLQCSIKNTVQTGSGGVTDQVSQ
jgi:ubiquitin carboxyl-terminal hydrolase 25/28